MKKYGIGAVTFHYLGFYWAVMGEDRVKLLRKVYRYEPLDKGMTMYVQSVGEITRDDVAWETAGKEVTG
jgi:hypothetical protein